MDSSPDNMPLVRLRDDLEISPGAPLLSGAPSWVIRDPVRHRFFQIGQVTLDVLSRWSAGSVQRLKERLFAEKAIDLSDEDLATVTDFLRKNQLLEGGDPGTAARYARAADKPLPAKLWMAARGLLFVRVPLVRPERFLQASWPFVRPLFTWGFVWLTFAALVLGLFLASRQAAEIEAHFRQAFSWGGALAFFAAVAFVKVLHELGHAYQATARGLRVPVMGIAFFAFLPLLFTDISDAWRLRSRRDRIMVDLGGVLVELTLAVYATLFWCFLADGPLRTVIFAIATSSWVLSLLVNLNPFLRFDGYFLLSDSLGLQNMQHRAFALGRWALRRALFALDDPIPEKVDPAMRRGLILYAYATWAYRFFLFIAIAVLVYTMFFKLAGLLLLLVAVTALIVRPALVELLYWFNNRNRILMSGRSVLTLTIALLSVGACFLPVSTRIHVPAVLEELHQQDLFPPEAARLDAAYVEEGDAVAAGDVLFQFSIPQLSTRINQAETRIQMLEARLLSAAGDETERAERTVVARILEEEVENLTALNDRQKSLLVLASQTGQVRDVSNDLDAGAWYPRDHLLGRIIDGGALAVRGFISEADLDRLDRAKSAHFFADEVSLPRIGLEGIDVSDFAVDRLPDGYHSRSNGGMVAVLSAQGGDLLVAGVWYPLSASLSPESQGYRLDDDRVQRGVIIARSKPQSLASRVGNRVAKVLVRELEL